MHQQCLRVRLLRLKKQNRRVQQVLQIQLVPQDQLHQLRMQYRQVLRDPLVRLARYRQYR